MARPGPIEVVGLRELNRAVSRSVDRDLPKRMGQANKQVGRLVISRLKPKPDPAAVGRGAGASVRPSATRREVLLRVGGSHRAGNTPRMQWGRRPARRPGERAPARPHIQKTARDNIRDIGDLHLRAISEAMSPAFADTEP